MAKVAPSTDAKAMVDKLRRSIERLSYEALCVVGKWGCFIEVSPSIISNHLNPTMFYVYLLQSLLFPDQKYIGYTANLKTRLSVHNRGGSIHTAKYMPWKLVMYLAFEDFESALDFEKYLKTGSGFAFAQKRLWKS